MAVARKRVRDVETNQTYPSLYAAGKALYGLVDGDPTNTRVWYQIAAAFPDRFQVEIDGAWVSTADYRKQMPSLNPSYIAPPPDSGLPPISAVKARPDLKLLSDRELLALHAAILYELRGREVVRTNNQVAADYAELLVWRALGGKIEPNSAKSWDVDTPDFARVQVKSRVVSNPYDNGQRQLSAFRSFEFDHLAVILFTPEYDVYDAALISVADVQAGKTYFTAYTNSTRVMADQALLSKSILPDFVDRLKAAQEYVAPAGAVVAESTA